MRSPHRRRRVRAAIGLGAGALLVCAATAQAHHIDVKKVVEGHGNGDSASFGFSAQRLAGASISPTGFSLSHAGTRRISSSGGATVRITESSMPAGYQFIGVACAKTDNTPFGTPDLANKRIDVTYTAASTTWGLCTFTNRKIVKVKVTKDFVDTTASRPGPADERVEIDIAGAGWSTAVGDMGSTPEHTVTSFPSVTVAERPATGVANPISLADYTTSLSCSGPNKDNATISFPVSGSGPANWTVGDLNRAKAGGTVNCTLTNTRDTGTLKIAKRLTDAPFGGAATFQFAGSVLGQGSSVEFTEASTKDVGQGTVPAGVVQTVTETAPEGYTFDAAASSCSSDAVSPSFGADGTLNVSVPKGTTVTCTFVNTPKGKIVVTKDVVNDNGGTAVPGDFTMNVTATEPGQSSFPGSAEGTTVLVTPGPYSVDETDAPGYRMTLGEGCEGTVAAGETKNCVITNDDIAPKLTVVKVVDNSNGGGTLNAADFSLQVQREGLGTISFPGSSAGTEVEVNAGSYAVTEPDTKGYSAAFSADCSGTVALGETKTCTVTNTSPTPKTPQTPETPRPPAVTPTPPPVVEATRTAPASLRITKTGPARARVLKRFGYTIRVRNSSRVVATNVVMRDTLPRGLVHLSSSPKATQTGRVLSVALGDLTPGQVRTIRVNVRAAGSVRGARTNTAVASADNARSVRDSARTVFVRPTVRIIPAVTG